MSSKNNSQELDFAIPPNLEKPSKKIRIKKGWIIFTIIVLLVVIIFHFSKPYINDFIREKIESIGHPDGPAYVVDQ